jgi:hypothetical protein
MLALVQLSGAALTDPESLTALAELAADHQLVLVCGWCGPRMPVMRRLRDTLPGRRLVAVLVTGDVVAQERRLVEELLAEQTVPLILTVDDPAFAPPANWSWLPAGRVLTLPR